MSAKPARMVQVRMERKTMIHREMTAWIDAEKAIEGAEVELLPSGEFWRIVKVFGGVVLASAQLKEMQDQHRQPPPSIRDAKKVRTS